MQHADAGSVDAQKVVPELRLAAAPRGLGLARGEACVVILPLRSRSLLLLRIAAPRSLFPALSLLARVMLHTAIRMAAGAEDHIAQTC